MITKQEVIRLFKYCEGELIREITTGSTGKKGSIAGFKTSKGYKQVGIAGKQHYIHRLIFLYHYGYLPKYIDHIDGDKLNNKIENLRECTNGQNCQNSTLRKDNTSGIKGVNWNNRTNKWRAVIYNKGKSISLGEFSHLFEAACSIIPKRLELHGEFANHG